MIAFLRRFFGLAKIETADEPILASENTPENTAAPEKTATAWRPALDVDSRFYPWLLGEKGSLIANVTEKPLLAALDRLCRSEFAGSNLIPRVPSVLPQLLKSLRDENVSGEELARHISRDVALVAELITEVNSSYYSPVDKISSLDNAIRLLGVNGLRMLVARTAFRPLIQLQSGQITKVLAPVIWEQSEKCALACRLLAQERQLDAFHGFLAGLLQNVGLIIAFRTVDQSMPNQAMSLSTEFRLRFLHMAQILSYRIAQQWDFPPLVTEALKQQFGSSDPLQGLALVVRQAGDLSKLRMLVNAGVISEQDEELAFSPGDQIQNIFLTLNQVSQ
ncbi:HDOD domain-containing protein [Undibacterium sp. TJN19]|uniref:HDOD domain-containing protein n=1 Tax=Undibacterium sp. TJN19 TaxID=3413055 RepID=UPI003BF40ADB